MKKYSYILILTIFVATPAILYRPALKHARTHVNWVTAVEDHPLNCLSCHLYRKKDGLLTGLLNKDYYSPYNLVVSPDGHFLYVVAQEGNSLLVVDTRGKKMVREIALGKRPHTVILDTSGEKAWVSCQWSDQIFGIDLAEGVVTDTLSTFGGPAGMAVSPDERFLWVVNSYGNNISLFDLESRREIKRLLAGNNPVAAALSPAGDRLFVTSRRSLAVPYGSPPETELTVADTRLKRISERLVFDGAYIMENVEATPDGDLILATLIRPKNLIPSIQVEKGWMMTHGIGIVDPENGDRIVQLLLDQPNAYYPDPFDITITPDGKRAFISSSGVNTISVVNLDSIREILQGTDPEILAGYANHLGVSERYVTERIHVGANPKGMALSPDGSYLYVAERLDDRIAVIDAGTLEVIDKINLGEPGRITVARHGRQLLNHAGHTFQNQYSCYTCHPDAHEDGLVYNMAASGMGRNLANVQSLRDIGDIPPYKWNGKNQTIYKQDGMRFSTVLTRTESFSHKELDALVAYIVTGIDNPPNLVYNPDGMLTPSQQRGKDVFYRTHTNEGREIPVGNRCYTCHPPPDFTNLQMVDVGTLSESDDPMLLDVPQLNNVFASSPYLHDGRAATLEELWTKFNDHDEHGVANDMRKDQLNDLVEYLKSIRDASHYQSEAEIYRAGIPKKTKKTKNHE